MDTHGRNTHLTVINSHKLPPSSRYLDSKRLTYTTRRRAADLSRNCCQSLWALNAIGSQIQPLECVWSVCGVRPQPRKYLSHGSPRNFNEHWWRAINTTEPGGERAEEMRRSDSLWCGVLAFKHCKRLLLFSCGDSHFPAFQLIVSCCFWCVCVCV